MKKTLVIIVTIILSLIITFVFAEIFNLYNFETIPTILTCIYLICLFSIFEYILLSICYVVLKKIKKEKVGIKRIISLVLFFISLILILGFIFMVDIDWLNYYSIVNSSPFYTFVLVRSLEFLLPSIVSTIIGIILLKRI